MAELFVRPEAEDELDALYDVDEDAAALIDVLLDELINDQATLEWLFRPHNHFRYKPPFEVKWFAEAYNTGRNILILKVHSNEGQLLSYRVLVGYHSQKDHYHVLTVVNREISYDTNDPHFAAVLDRYERCGIPVYGKN